MVNIKDTLKGIEGLQKQVIALVDENLTDEMIQKMSSEQKEMITEARKGLNFNGLNSSEKLNNITQILKKNGF